MEDQGREPMPTFSVIIPVYNRRDVLLRAVTSVLEQTFRDLELIVVDDGSDDGSSRVVNTIDDSRVQVVSQANSGANVARNHGASSARGQYLTFLDSDDEAVPEWLSKYHSAIDASGAVLVSCGFVDVAEGVNFDAGQVALPSRNGRELCGVTSQITTGGTYVLRRDIFNKIGGFAAEQSAGQHSEMAYRLLPLLVEQGAKITHIDEALIIRHSGRSDSMRRDHRRVFDGGRRILEVHADRLMLNPQAFAQHASSTAVRGARIGDFTTARHLMWRAARAQPKSLKYWARLFVLCIPPLARRVWPCG